MNKHDSRRRPALMAGVALAGLVFGAGSANAQTAMSVNTPRLSLAELQDERHGGLSLDPNDVVNERHVAPALDPNEVVNERHNRGTGVTTAFENYVGQADAVNEPEIVISVPGTPITSRDPVNINGVGQMIVSTPSATGGVSLGLCTGTLINPCTVLFAAHCVNSRPATAYGSGSGDRKSVV